MFENVINLYKKAICDKPFWNAWIHGDLKIQFHTSKLLVLPSLKFCKLTWLTWSLLDIVQKTTDLVAPVFQAWGMKLKLPTYYSNFFTQSLDSLLHSHLPSHIWPESGTSSIKVESTKPNYPSRCPLELKNRAIIYSTLSYILRHSPLRAWATP